LNERLKLSNNKGYIISIGIMLILVSSLILGYYIATRLPPEGYTAIYLLGYPQKKAMDYPEFLVINRNNTFSVWVKVENHMGKTIQCKVQLKVANVTVSTLPVEVDPSSNYVKTLEKEESWEILATVSINNPGNYSSVYELWIYDQDIDEFEFTYNYCVLNIEVVDQS
jgi:uncharacterized membrane protein